MLKVADGGGRMAVTERDRVRLEDLLGRRVRYAGVEGRVVEGQCAGDAFVVIMVATLGDAPPRLVNVPQSEWGRIEVLRRQV